MANMSAIDTEKSSCAPQENGEMVAEWTWSSDVLIDLALEDSMDDELDDELGDEHSEHHQPLRPEK